MRNRLLLFFPLLFSLLFSQTGSISGTVKGLGHTGSTDGDPLISASVYLKGTMIGAITDTSGYYNISRVPVGKYTLSADYFGFKSQSKEIYISVGDMKDGGVASGLQKLLGLSDESNETSAQVIKGNQLSDINFLLTEDVFASDEVVVTGVASERSVEVSEVSVTRLDPRHLNEFTSYPDFGTMLSAKVSGLDIRKASGTVGGGFRFDMRAGGGLNGSEQPIIILDGIRITNAEVGNSLTGGQGISTLLDFNPDDIENIEILKGPAAATSYGTNGSNGIVFIETKKGKAGLDKPVFTYKHTTGSNNPEFNVDEGFHNRDLFHSLLSPGAISDNYFSVNGGDYKSRYFVSFSNRYEEGMIIWKEKNNFNRSTIRANFDFLPQENLKLSINSSYSDVDTKIPPSDNNIYGVLYNTLVSYEPWQEADSAALSNFEINLRSKRIMGRASVTYYPFQDINKYGLNTLVVKGNVALNDIHRDESRSMSADYTYGQNDEGAKRLERSNNTSVNYDFGVAHTFSKGPIVATSSLSAQFFDHKTKNMRISRQYFGQSAVTDLGSASDIVLADEGLSNTRDAGGVFTEELSYDDQYFLTFSYRKDYASGLGTGNKSIGYPGFRFSTRLDKFGFVPEQFRLLKLRMAYGESGVLPGHNDGQELLWSGSTGGYGSGAQIAVVGNPDIEPERITELEVGLDLTWESLLSLELTAYQQSAENSIIYKPLAPSSGYGNDQSRPENIGSMEMEGFETLLRLSPIRKKDLKVDITASYSWNDNIVNKMGDPIFDRYGIMTTREGYPKYTLWGREVEGARIDTFNLALLGMEGLVPYFDPLGGVVAGEEGMLDRSIPQHTGNLSISADYKIFDFFMLFERKTGFMTGVGGMWWASAPNNNGHTAWLESIQKLGIDGLFAQMGVMDMQWVRQITPVVEEDEVVGTVNMDLYMATGGAVPPLPVAIPGKEAEWEAAANEYAFSHPEHITNYGEDGSYTRLREINFGVNLTRFLPVLKMENAISGLRVYFSAQNVKLWRPSGTVGIDSEINAVGAVTPPIGQTNTGYRSIEAHTMPHPTTYNFGINVRF